MSSLQRRDDSSGEQRATALELFYDLVFVFAITQVSHVLLEHLTWVGVGQSVFVLLVVWWSWNYTTWVTNELNTDATIVRLLLIALMLGGLIMAVSIPEAFGERSLLFAASYVAIQVGRHLFLTFVAADAGTVERERSFHILVWFIAAGVLWISGALIGGAMMIVFWLAALTLDYAAPLATYWVPGRQRLSGETWNVGTGHFAERFQLFIIIALGETVVITGATTSELDLDTARIAAFATAFLSTAAFWWLYFGYVARIAERRLEIAPNRTLLARDGYTYLHVLMVAGIILSAVGDELIIAHPTEVLPPPEVAVVAAGPALYLSAHTLFRIRMTGTFGLKRPVGAVACVAVGFIGLFVPALVLAALLIGVLVTVIAAEYTTASRMKSRGEPTPLEKLESSPVK